MLATALVWGVRKKGQKLEGQIVEVYILYFFIDLYNDAIFRFFKLITKFSIFELVQLPNWFASTSTPLLPYTATQELVVPRSIPTAIVFWRETKNTKCEK